MADHRLLALGVVDLTDTDQELSENPYQAPGVEQTSEVPPEDNPLEEAKKRLAPPARALIVMASFSAVYYSIACVSYLVVWSGLGETPANPMTWFVLPFLMFGVHVFQSIGAAKMGFLESQRLAYAGAILSVIPVLSPLIYVGIPFGIWALVLLRQPEISQAFELARLERKGRSADPDVAKS